ncbi:DUF3039 domain-containing protein [Saccharopolyspora hattusasensis]|uniref:DUF3039 domain-containing protein n=1 Tax=Saccharopolyspora hattusasensis TaxID=1128679 RepID=UPI003D983923
MILARLRPEHAPQDRPREVHAYRVPADNGAAAIWRAPCGDEVKPDEVEPVPAFTGTPCVDCFILAVLGSDAPPVSRNEFERAPQRTELSPEPMASVVKSSSTLLLYAPSWREEVVHWAKPNEPTKPFGKGTVVPGLCGAIGWGPRERPPDGWPMCSECVEIASEESD